MLKSVNKAGTGVWHKKWHPALCAPISARKWTMLSASWMFYWHFLYVRMEDMTAHQGEAHTISLAVTPPPQRGNISFENFYHVLLFFWSVCFLISYTIQYKMGWLSRQSWQSREWVNDVTGGKTAALISQILASFFYNGRKVEMVCKSFISDNGL